MTEFRQHLQRLVRGPEPVRWAGELYGSDVEFTLAMDDGVPSDAVREIAETANSKAEFRERILDAYYQSC